MAGVLRTAAVAVRASLEGGALAGRRAAAQAQQARGNHDLSVHHNKHIEKWLSRREDIEQEFTWDGRTTRSVLIGAFLLPIATYNMLVYMAHQVQQPERRARA
ncbi:hypothetical protein MNEG_6074 [Monoraphidium neglectum]|jgi:hypothetical protein|uniref:Uncharacterized protein n=1 Tax=Monoraphidium neglectum TaxID=145388 RepID=A0A0D2L3X4_9CHLO|nr:hypothetical protein MNEG_6074 [Monoraphidium neglectum]KIZ01884.1 hypothetical protein MNEG_6074 [Monoraphidium neglectum]|eukprot:XP_013900903.1 hypothetical protein MNEG_6074 [Monoraphidium neglectum]